MGCMGLYGFVWVEKQHEQHEQQHHAVDPVRPKSTQSITQVQVPNFGQVSSGDPREQTFVGETCSVRKVGMMDSIR